jgi:hypothetical protein
MVRFRWLALATTAVLIMAGLLAMGLRKDTWNGASAVGRSRARLFNLNRQHPICVVS